MSELLADLSMHRKRMRGIAREKSSLTTYVLCRLSLQTLGGFVWTTHGGSIRVTASTASCPQRLSKSPASLICLLEIVRMLCHVPFEVEVPVQERSPERHVYGIEEIPHA